MSKALVWTRRALFVLACGFLLFIGISLLFSSSGSSWFAVVLTLAGVWGLGLLLLDFSGRTRTPTKGSTVTEWWYNHKTKQVEEGPQSLGSDRDGPYATREDAARAPEIAAERARQWAAEDD